jgi:hypothetical protein|tara:strand:+ start:319 stop:540 length:222 start_codon:yes stop_codon:yes gene_type:complete
MKIEKLLIYNTAIRDNLHNKMAGLLNADIPDEKSSLIPYFETVNKYLDEATVIERRIQFLERIKKDNEESNNK